MDVLMKMEISFQLAREEAKKERFSARN